MLAISPVFKMQSESYGYDVIDFIDINPLLGTLQDFKDLTTAAKSKSKTHFIFLNLKYIFQCFFFLDYLFRSKDSPRFHTQPYRQTASMVSTIFYWN